MAEASWIVATVALLLVGCDAGHVEQVTESRWVDVVGSDVVESGNNRFGPGDSCAISPGQHAELVEHREDEGRVLARYQREAPAYGTACPGGVLFEMDAPSYFGLSAPNEVPPDTTYAIHGHWRHLHRLWAVADSDYLGYGCQGFAGQRGFGRRAKWEWETMETMSYRLHTGDVRVICRFRDGERSDSLLKVEFRKMDSIYATWPPSAQRAIQEATTPTHREDGDG